jgi:multimeric flavodoxin WrbA
MSKMVLGIYGSPRKGGNTDRLLDRALEGARSAGAEIRRIYARDLRMSGCLECGGCDKTGECVVKDDMQSVYPLLEEAEVIILASPIFFYALTAQVKALVDRGQAMWSKRLLEKGPTGRKRHDGGRGYLIAVGATRGKSLFDGVMLEAKYFYDALDMTYEGGLLYRDLEKRSDVERHPEKMEEAFDLGRKAVTGQG